MPRPAAPGAVSAYDYEYERTRECSSLFMLFAPLDGWRRDRDRERRTKVDWAHVVKRLVDARTMQTESESCLVMDRSRNTHKLSSALHRAFERPRRGVAAERLDPIQLRTWPHRNCAGVGWYGALTTQPMAPAVLAPRNSAWASSYRTVAPSQLPWRPGSALVSRVRPIAISRSTWLSNFTQAQVLQGHREQRPHWPPG